MSDIIYNAGAPSAGTSEVQTLTIGGTPTSGTFRLRFEGLTTGAITWSATNNTLVANIDAALEALGSIGTGGVVAAVGTMTAGIGTITLTFGGNRAKEVVPLIEVAYNNLVGTSPTLAIAETTPGVRATGRGAPKGAILIDTTTPAVYQNTGTALAPDWTSGPIIADVTASAAEINKLDGAGAVVASGTAHAHIADIAVDANGTAIAAAVNAILDALEAFGIAAGS